MQRRCVPSDDAQPGDAVIDHDVDVLELSAEHLPHPALHRDLEGSGGHGAGRRMTAGAEQVARDVLPSHPLPGVPAACGRTRTNGREGSSTSAGPGG